MTSIFMGILLLIMTLTIFSTFSLKAPKGESAMQGLAQAAVASFLVEAIHRYVNGGLLGSQYFNELGSIYGKMGGPAAAILVTLNLGVNPVFGVVAGIAVMEYGILSGFIAGYIISFIAPHIEKRLPDGVNMIVGVILLAPLTRIIAYFVSPVVNNTLFTIGQVITMAAEQSPYFMGFFLGGVIKIMCTSPMSSMALTAMINLQGLAMGIAAISSFAGAFTNGYIFNKLKLGDKSDIISVMLEPLTQADVISKNPIPVYLADFIGGGLGGIAAAYFGIVNNAAGTASPIPGMLAPFGFNPPSKVILTLFLAAAGGLIGGYIGHKIYILTISLKEIILSNDKGVKRSSS